MSPLLFLVACGGMYDGSWLLSFVYKAAEGESTGQREDLVAPLYTTSSGKTALDFAGTLLTGDIEAGVLSVSLFEAYTYARAQCTYRSAQEFRIEGEFEGTSRITGELQLKYTADDCGDEQVDVTGYTMTGVRLDADPSAHARGLTYTWFEGFDDDYGDVYD